MDIFRWDSISFSYQRAWPPEDWYSPHDSYSRRSEKSYEVGGVFDDVDNDGVVELVALTHTDEWEDQGRKLSIYKLSNGTFALISQLDVTSPYIAIDILGIRRLHDGKQIVLLHEKEQEEQIVGGYDFKGGHLEFIWLNDKIKAKRFNPSLLESVDIDGDGQEEMRFVDKVTGQSVILKGEKEFSPDDPF